METIKEKIPMIIVGIIVLALCAGIFYFLENYEAVYYTQIDNTKIQKLSTSDDMKYEYTLDCYNERGNKKEIKFKTGRELRETAYLMLEVRALGVHSWKEVQYQELPEMVKGNLPKKA